MKHAVLGASGSYRWMNCPGSRRLAEGMPETDTEYAREGTAAHALAERALTNGFDCDVWLDTPIPVAGKDGEIHQVLVTEEMVEAVQVFVDYVRRRKEELGATLLVEEQFDLAPLDPPEQMFGTSDAVLVTDELMEVVDLKYGAGVVVDAVGNPQLRYYGLGALLAVGQKVDRYRLTIVQPRAFHPDGIIRSDEISFEELRDFKRDLFERARATQSPDAPLVVGPWCRFCRALPVCPAQRETAIAVAQSEFEAFSPPDPQTLTLEQLNTVLQVAPQLEDWLSSVRQYAVDQLLQGNEVPGWKLVEGRAGNRRWRDEDYVRGLENMYNVDLHERRPMSPAKAEKVLGGIGVSRDVLAELVTRSPGKPTLVPVTDPRPELNPSAADDFDTVSEPNEAE